MKKSLIALSSMLMLGSTAFAQKVAFEEYDLPMVCMSSFTTTNLLL
jgi:hypothetical protein